jgi:hypothetical protein
VRRQKKKNKRNKRSGGLRDEGTNGCGRAVRTATSESGGAAKDGGVHANERITTCGEMEGCGEERVSSNQST